MYRILKRIVDAIETLVQGSASEIVDAQKQEAETRIKALELEARQTLIAQVLVIRKTLPEEAGKARDRIDRILADTIAVDLAEDETGLVIIRPRNLDANDPRATTDGDGKLTIELHPADAAIVPSDIDASDGTLSKTGPGIFDFRFPGIAKQDDVSVGFKLGETTAKLAIEDGRSTQSERPDPPGSDRV